MTLEEAIKAAGGLRRATEIDTDEEPKAQEDWLVCPYNGFSPCFMERCPFWASTNADGQIIGACLKAQKELGR